MLCKKCAVENEFVYFKYTDFNHSAQTKVYIIERIANILGGITELSRPGFSIKT